MSYSFYILYSDKIDNYYKGISKNPKNRLNYHNHQNKGWTRRGRPWTLVFNKEYPDRATAQKAEKFVKSKKSKSYIRKLISGEYKLPF
ncbi:MAG: GIY-YIG nuclease family protein [Fidelibacterota bacterium]